MANPVRVVAPNPHFDGMIGDVQFEDGVAEFDAVEHPGVLLHCATSGYDVGAGYHDAAPGEDEPSDATPPSQEDYLAAAVGADKVAADVQTWAPAEGEFRATVDVGQPPPDATKADWVEFVTSKGFDAREVEDMSKDDIREAAIRAGIAV